MPLASESLSFRIAEGPSSPYFVAETSAHAGLIVSLNSINIPCYSDDISNAVKVMDTLATEGRSALEERSGADPSLHRAWNALSRAGFFADGAAPVRIFSPHLDVFEGDDPERSIETLLDLEEALAEQIPIRIHVEKTERLISTLESFSQTLRSVSTAGQKDESRPGTNGSAAGEEPSTEQTPELKPSQRFILITPLLGGEECIEELFEALDRDRLSLWHEYRLGEGDPYTNPVLEAIEAEGFQLPFSIELTPEEILATDTHESIATELEGLLNSFPSRAIDLNLQRPAPPP